VDAGQSVAINVLSNDTDPDGHALTVTDSDSATNGTVSCTASSCTFTAASDANGDGSFDYTISDGNGGSDSATVSVTINAAGKTPLISEISDQSAQGGESYSLAITVSDEETTAEALTVTATSDNQLLVAGDNLSVVGTGSQRTVDFVTEPAQFGTARITVTVTDADEQSADTFFTVSVLDTVLTPAISPDGSEFQDSVTVSISSETPEATIYYTTDGSTPDNTSTIYTEALNLTETTTVNAIAVKDNYHDSAVATMTYTLFDPATIAFDWDDVGGSGSNHGSLSGGAMTSTFNGAIPGDAGVSGGAASYSIPIVVPPGRNGVQPGVSLNYSSRSGMGIAGVGWSLSAGSSISRCPATFAQDNDSDKVRFDGNDKLCLDGQRLISVSGAYGASGTQYATEIDSQVRVTQRGSLASSGVSFDVTLPDGGVRYYGSDSNARVSPSQVSQELSWLVDEYRDVSGNSMHYN
jgi:hypothetical protein